MLTRSCGDGLVPDAKRIKTRKFSFHAVIEECLASTSVLLIDFLVVEVGDKRWIPKLLPLLPLLPQRLSHLKRIKGESILMCERLGDIAKEALCEIRKLTSVDFSTVNVPAVKPRTRAQYEEARKYWPTSFHEDKVLEKRLNGCMFDANEMDVFIEMFLRVEMIGGALIYDPVSKRVVIGETSGDKNKPLHHPVILLIKALADLQNSATHSHEQYLATGFDAFLAEEPCTMCAMSLVHSRVNRIFFGALNPKLGALVSRWRLQESKNINHRYQVIRLVEECA